MGAQQLTIQAIAKTVSCVAASYDINRVYLFGSCARNQATAESDIDLCLETGPTFSLFNAGDFCSQLENLLETPVDAVTERSLYPAVRKNMLKDRVLVYERI